LPEKEIIVKSECYSVTYYPGYYENIDDEIFVREAVEISKKTDEVMLGEYVGESFNALLKDFNNKIIVTSNENENYTYYSYDSGKNKNSFRRVFVEIDVVDTIITKISYGYEL